jgi:hypothetical protein
MKNLKKVVLVLFVTAMFLFTGMSDLFAKGGRSGGSRSSSGKSSSFGRPSKSSPSKTSPSGVTNRKSSVKAPSKSRTTAAPKRTATQQKSFEASKQNGTSKMTKTQSMDKFKSNPAMQKKYTSKYATKPTTRPSHVPQTTQVGGKTVNITYNQAGGGYGYTNALGAYIMYDMMSDAMMRNRMMTQNGYLYAGHPSVVGTVAPVHHMSMGTIILSAFLGVVVLCFFGFFLSKL